MEDIILFGSGGHAKVVLDSLVKQGEYNALGIIDDYKEVGIAVWEYYKVIGKLEDLKNLQCPFKGIVTIGDNWTRYLVTQRILEIYPNFEFVNAIHPSAQIAYDVKIGGGNVIMANTAINSSSRIGNHCIINTNASLDHDNVLEDFVSIAPGVALSGRVSIGAFSNIGTGANIIQNINVGEHTIIGAGATVINDILPYVIALGVPARIKRTRKKGEKYL